MTRARRAGLHLSTDAGATRAATLTVLGVIVAALVALAGIGTVLRGGNDGDDRGAPAAQSASPSASASSPSPAASSSKAAPTKKPKATKSAPAATSKAGSKPAPKAKRSFSGSGNKILTIKKAGDATGPALVVASSRGGGTFGILALDAGMQMSDILVNVKGPYSGTNLLDARQTRTQHLKVVAKGPWTVKIKPVTAARTVDATAKGKGDDVLQYTGPKGVATFDYRGGLNFVVSYASATANSVLVNQVGGYHGQVKIPGPALIDVSADGKWTMQVAS